MNEHYNEINLDVGSGFSIFHKRRLNCLKVDVQRDIFIDVICDAHSLPFKNLCFDKVFCSHVLEHLSNPAMALKELIRVSKSYVYIEVPHWLSSNAKQSAKGNIYDKHVCSFKCNWFHKSLRKIPHHVEVHYRFPRFLYIVCEIYLQGKNK